MAIAFLSVRFAGSQPGGEDEINAVIGLARAVPPEFSADALITLAQSGLITASRKREELLRDAFRLAESAQEPVALKRVYPGSLIDVDRTFAFGFDSISLRARAVKALLLVNPPLAREYFSFIGLDLPPILDCNRSSVYNPALYYAVMAEVMNSMSSTGDITIALNNHLAQFRSTSQIQPLAGLFGALKGSPSDFGGPLLLYAEHLSKLDRDVPVFSANSQDAVSALVKLSAKLPPGLRDSLINGARSWVIAGSVNGLCRGRRKITLGPDGQRTPVETTSVVRRFNKELAPQGSSKDSPVINENDLSFPPELPPAPYVKISGKAADLYKSFSILAADAERDSLRWKAEMDKFIVAASQWNEGATFNDGDADDTAYLKRHRC